MSSTNQAEREYLAGHRAHDFDALMERWQVVADSAEWETVTLAMHGDYPVIGYRSQAAWDDGKALYLCAGVHGDEPAGVWGLLEWAEQNGDFLCGRSLLVLPCFNPWGMVENRRCDHRGRDLNRMFHQTSMALFKGWRRFVGDRKFRLALLLHEDYDAQGLYIYELGRRGCDFGHPILEKCQSIIPIESRPEVDGNEFDRGVLVRKQGFQQLVEERLEGGYPEAIYLRIHHAQIALTFETPSEYSLWDRVRAQSRFLDAAMEECAG